MVQTTNNGVASTHPLFSISIQHRFFSVQDLLTPGRHGMIGSYFPSMTTPGESTRAASAMGGVEVRLDEDRVTRTDSSGYYSFSSVRSRASGRSKAQRDEPFFYTTDSPATVDMNATADSASLRQRTDLRLPAQRRGRRINESQCELNRREIYAPRSDRRERQVRFTGLVSRQLFGSHTAGFLPARIRVQDLAAQTVAVESGKPATRELR